MTVGSLFAGIGGFDLGFERTGFETVWQVEINEWARRVLAKNFPKAERYADIRECGSHNLKPADVIVGGFPCQDISNAGLRAGIEGERSGLWSEMHRIIRELQPRYVLVENVAALLGRGMGRVLGDLAEIGYDAEWEIVSAADVGAPHLRQRVWILAYPRYSGLCERRRDSNAGEEVLQAGGDGWHELPGQQKLQRKVLARAESERCGEAWGVRHNEPAQRAAGDGEDVSDANLQQYEGGASSDSGAAAAELSLERSSATWWAVEPNVGRVAHGVPARVDRLRGLGNAVVPQIPELYAQRIAELLTQARAA